VTIRTPLSPALAGCTIVVAADRRAGDLASALERRGAQVYRAPALSIIPNADDDELLERTRQLISDPPDIVIVTTGVGFRGWIDAAHENDLAEELTDALAGAQFIARGPKARGRSNRRDSPPTGWPSPRPRPRWAHISPRTAWPVDASPSSITERAPTASTGCSPISEPTS
jgi:hypothetical protein